MSSPAQPAAVIQFSLSAEALDVAALAATLDDPAAGAVVTFDGRVRETNDGKPVTALEYQAYAALAEPIGTRILNEEAARHGILRATASHRCGNLEIGEAAIWLGVAAARRSAAFDAARAILERLKYDLPVWKKETYADGSSAWVGPDNSPADGGEADAELPEWTAELLEIWISPGNNFRGRHGQEQLHHEICSVPQIECVAGMGLHGDRYFGYSEDFKGQVTFFDADVVAAVREHFKRPDLSSREFRRNLIVSGVDLPAWVGRRFRFQGVEFEGSEECRPCYWMDQAVGPRAEEFLQGRGGLRARILSNGKLTARGS